MTCAGFDDAGNPLTETALLDEIAMFRKAIRDAATNNVGVVAGEGRRIEFTSVNVDHARAELRELLRIARQRGLAIGGNPDSIGAIVVEIG